MPDFIFRFPIKLEDLKSLSGASDSYRVIDSFGPLEIVQIVTDLNESHSDPDFILDKFDAFYNFLVNFEHFDTNGKDLVWKLMLKTMYRMHAMFNDLLANADSHAIIDLRERRQNCNVLKMNVYVFCQMVQLFDEYTRKQSETIDAKGRKKVKSTESAYEKDKEKATRVLLMMCSLPIHWLFEPQIVEEDFVNCITQLCWKVLDNANMISKQKTLCVNVFSLLGIAVEKHRQTLNFALNLINFLRQKDSQVSLMVNLVEHLIANNDQGEIVNEIVRNICDLDKSELARDTGGTKALSVFLSDLANKCSVYFIETIPHLNALLDDEPYGLRNATLSIIGTLILEHYSDPDMDEEKIVKRDELLDLLEDHLLDSNTYSRGRALQVFTRLCDEKKLPLSKLHKLIQSVVHRLLDRSTYVRKQAVKFLSAFITVSPFVLRIPLPILKEQLDKESNRLKACLDKIAEEAGGSSQVNQSQNEPESDDQDEQMDCDAESEEEKENKVNRLKKKKEDEANENEITAEKDNMLMNQVAPTAAGSASLADLDPTDVDKQRILVKYLTDCVWYSDHIQKAIPLVCSLLYSKSITDIEEAIEFFVIAAKCEIDGALFGVRKLISLIFSNEKSVQDSILKAYTDIYIDSANFSEMGPKAKARAVVQCFTELVEGATSGEMVAMEEVLTKLMDNNRIDISYLNVMWERFTKNQPNTTDQDSRIAVKLIGMLANSKPELIRDNLDLLITHGLGERAEKDLALATNTLEAIRKSAVNRGKVDPEEPSFRLAADHEMFNRVYHLLMHNIDENSANWLPFANHVLKCFFLFHPFPNQISEKLLKECIQMIMKRVKTIEHDSSAHEAALPFTTSSQSSQPMYPTEHANLVKNIPTRLFSHFLYLVGEAALNELLLIEVDIATELKIRDALKQLQEETKNKNRANAKTPSRRKSAVPKTPGENLDEEMGLAGAQADDETDFLQLICNEQIVEKTTHRNFLARLSGVLISIATDPVKFSNVQLQISASLALSKFMLVSEKFARAHLRLFFTILEMTPEPAIKINSIIACGDLCVRFPNLLDPWTPKLYSALRSKNTEVRATTFKVVSRLILSDMIKIKEQISEVAKMIVDEDASLAQMASYFFKELAKKNNNAIYNILPEVISNLSNAEVGIGPDHFQIILAQLIELVEKDKQTICLVEKLCYRFKLVDREREYNDLAFCLTQMQLSERSLMRICENLPCFADKLVFNQVYDHILTVIANAKKLTGLKSETKQALDDFVKKVEEIRRKGLEDPNAMQEELESSITERASGDLANASALRTPSVRNAGRSTRKKAIELRQPASTRKTKRTTNRRILN